MVRLGLWRAARHEWEEELLSPGRVYRYLAHRVPKLSTSWLVNNFLMLTLDIFSSNLTVFPFGVFPQTWNLIILTLRSF
jgi:hypothetical protein